MKALANVALWAGVISMVIGLILRAMSATVQFGLIPSSFLEFSIACFLLSIAVSVSGK